MEKNINTHKGEQEALRRILERNAEIARAQKSAASGVGRLLWARSKSIELPVANLTDKLYEKRKLGGLEMEAIVKQIGDENEEEIWRLVQRVTAELVNSTDPYHREGGVMALSAVAVALGPTDIEKYFDLITGPIFEVLDDTRGGQTKYYTLEALYNVMKVAKDKVFGVFCRVFDACCRLMNETDTATKSAGALVDSLLKDIFAEYYEPGKVDMKRFVAVLNAHVRVTDSTARQFIISWITLLESLPSVNLLSYSTFFIGGLMEYLADPLRGISSGAHTLLSLFERDIAQRRIPSLDYDELTTLLSKKIQLITNSNLFASASSTANAAAAAYFNQGMDHLPQLPVTQSHLPATPRGARSGRSITRKAANTSLGSKPTTQLLPSTQISSQSAAAIRTKGNARTGSGSSNSGSGRVPKQEKRDLILVTAMQWLETLVCTAQSEIVDRMPYILGVTLPYLSDKPNKVATEAALLNQELLLFVRDAKIASPDSYIPAISRAIENRAVVASRLAGLTWLALIRKKFGQAAAKCLDTMGPMLLKLLSDPSEEVMLLNMAVLEMFTDSEKMFYKEMAELANIFSREAMGKRGAKVLQLFCRFVQPERVYAALSEILAKEGSASLVSEIIQTLNLLLLSLEETRSLRLTLRNNLSQSLFETMYRAWAYSPSSLFTFCLLCQKYTHAYELVKEL